MKCLYVLQAPQTAKCEGLFHCVLCKMHNKGPLSPKECDTNCTTPIIAVDAFEGKFSHL